MVRWLILELVETCTGEISDSTLMANVFHCYAWYQNISCRSRSYIQPSPYERFFFFLIEQKSELDDEQVGTYSRSQLKNELDTRSLACIEMRRYIEK